MRSWGLPLLLRMWWYHNGPTEKLQRISLPWWSQKQGGLRELPATWVLFPRGEEGGQKIAAISPNQVQKIARCYSFSNHAVSSPPDDGCEDARRPTGRLRDDPLILVLMMGSLRTSQAAGGFTITPHNPGVQCCTKRGQAETFDRILVIWCSRLIKPNIAWSSWPRKTFFPHSIFHGARLCRLGAEWEGSVIKTEFKPEGALKNLLSCRSSDYNVVDSVFPEYKSWGVLLASWPQTWSIQAFLYGEEQS